MEKLLRFLILFFASVFISSCGVIKCVDSQFEREPIPIKGELGLKKTGMFAYSIKLTSRFKRQKQLAFTPSPLILANDSFLLTRRYMVSSFGG